MLRTFTSRAGLRFATHGPADYFGPDFIGKGIVCNISQSGWRIEGEHSVRPGMELSLSTTLPGQAGPIKVDKAVVRWVKGGWFGISIIEMRAGDRTRQAEYLSGLLDRLLR